MSRTHGRGRRSFVKDAAGPGTYCASCGADLSGRPVRLVQAGRWRPFCPWRCAPAERVELSGFDAALRARRPGTCWALGDPIDPGQLIAARHREWAHPECWAVIDR